MPDGELADGGLALGPLLDQVSDLVFLLRADEDEQYIVVDLNQAYVDGLKYAALTRDDVIGRPASEVVRPETWQFVESRFREALATGSVRYEQSIEGDGWQVTMDVHLSAIRDVDGTYYLLGAGRDVTEQRRMAEQLRASERRFAALVERSSDITTVVDADGNLTYASPAATRILGWDAEDVGDTGAFSLIHPDDVQRVAQVFQAGLADDRTEGEPVEYRMLRKDGEWVWIESTGSNLLDDPAVGGVVVNSRDITERKLAQAALAHQARHDPLTGLPNRLLMLDRIQVALAQLGRSREAMALLYLDLDRFKLINDGLGHTSGDQLLVAVGERLSSVLRPGDSVGRQGGDEFAILCVGLRAPEDAVGLAERLADAMQEPFALQGNPTFVTASIGIAIATADTEVTAEELLTRADVAMYQAKEHGRARYEIFDAEMQAEAAARLETRNAVRTAVDEHQFRLVYQPEIQLDGGDVWVEALLRWDHPERGVVGPDQFIDVAEESGLIVPMGRWVLEEACRQAHEWTEAEGDHPDVVCVNISPRQLADAELVPTIARVLRDTGLPPHMLLLEITENAVVDDPEKALGVLGQIKNLGVGLAIDDFGTGYSSLALLRRFPVDALKVDRAFVAGMTEDPNDRAIVAAVIGLAHNLGVVSVAEGVETEAQLADLRSMGCQFAQGYLWARPMAPDTLTDWMAAHDR